MASSFNQRAEVSRGQTVFVPKVHVKLLHLYSFLLPLPGFDLWKVTHPQTDPCLIRERSVTGAPPHRGQLVVDFIALGLKSFSSVLVQ